VPPRFERVAICGVGLIGGSFALAARAAGLIGETIGFGRSAANLQVALERGIIDRATHDVAEAVRDADLVLLATPITSMAAVLRAAAPALKSGAIVTDAGSVKLSVIEELEPLLPATVAFVGAHPIAGTEDAGAAAARVDLFQAARCILTPSDRSTPAAIAQVRQLWEGVGMTVDLMDAARHDAILGWVSHLPHVIAFSLVDALLSTDPQFADFAGPSFRSATRVAASSSQMWADILLANANAVEIACARFVASVANLRQAIAAGDRQAIIRILEAARVRHPAVSSAGGART
jgi:prephenate dehydrogenase